MENLGEAYYNLGVNLFEGGYYEQAVEYLVRAYNLGFEKKQILENLYACFICPNEQEFLENFLYNNADFIQISIEECLLDFIPVSEHKFYIFDKEKEEFAGIIELEKEPIQEEKRGNCSILFADIWDIREMIPRMKEKKWSVVYIVLNGQEKRFASFFKLPKFKELYLRDVAFFHDTNLMYDVFGKYEEFYLPKYVVGIGCDRYLKLFQKIHEQRIHNIGARRKNIFLSICIPSYNRGSVALQNVNHLLQCLYDSEIEIIISNNGSIKDTEGYKEISKIKDSRLVYHEFEENQGFASNVLKTLELAKGKFAVLVSDEDLMILENMGQYLDCLRKNESCGVFLEGGIGSFINVPEDKLYKAGKGAIDSLIDENYMTGLTFNMGIMKKIHAFDVIAKMRGNSFLEYYIHIPLALLIGKHADVYFMKLILWDARKAVNLKGSIPKYMLPQNRIGQQNDAMEFLQKGLEMDEEELVITFFERSLKTYYLLELAYGIEKFREIYTWEEICFFVYKEHLKYLKNSPTLLLGERKEPVQNAIREMFLKYLNSERVFAIYPLEKKEKKKAIYQEIQRKLEKGKSIEEVEIESKEKGYLIETEKNGAEVDIIDTFAKNVEN